MKVKLSFLILIFIYLNIWSQPLNANSVMGIPNATTAAIQAINGAQVGSIMYSNDELVLYQFNGTNWVITGTDNLGNHIASQNVEANGFWYSGDGDNEGVTVTDSGNVGISNTPFTPERQFHVAGTNGGIRLDRFGNDSFFFFVNKDITGANVIYSWAMINDNLDNSFQIRNYGTAVAGNGLGNALVLKETSQLQLPSYGTPTTFNNNAPVKILGVTNDGSVVQATPSVAGIVYEKIVIWAEEAAALSDNSLEWSFGNSATGQIGIPLPEAWEAYAVSFNSDINGANDSVEIAITNSVNNTNLFTFTATANGNADNMVYTEILTMPVAIPAGTSIGFRTVSKTGVINDARVAVFLRRQP